MTDFRFLSRWRETAEKYLKVHGRSAGQLAKRILLLEIEANQSEAKAAVEPGIPMKGVRLWFLIASCLIASVGLNTNSGAVIIGAMLISPLMGPILGLGFGLATASRHTIRAASWNLGFAVLISLIFASLYFLISPFQDVTSEILSRTAPNLLDLLVAVAAGFAGVVALNSPSLSGAAPGVAVAIAMMPPLCACGYGLAHADWRIALGAFYLFFVNAVAIALVSFLLFRRMHYARVARDAPEGGGIRPAVITAGIVLVVAPLSWSLWNAWRDNFVDRSVSRLVQSYKDKLEIVSWQWVGGRERKLTLYDFRKIPDGARAEIEKALHQISPQATLEVHENAPSPEIEELAAEMRTSPITTLVKNPKVVEGLVRLATDGARAADLQGRVRDAESELAALAGRGIQVRGYLNLPQAGKPEALFTVAASSRAARSRLTRELPRYLAWLRARFKDDADVRAQILSSITKKPR